MLTRLRWHRFWQATCLCEMDKKQIVTAVRVACVSVCLYTSVTITWQSVLSWLLLLASLYLLQVSDPEEKEIANPLKGKPNKLQETLPDSLILTVNKEISSFLTHDGAAVRCLDRFSLVKDNTECIFAKKAKLWGSRDWNYKLSLEENIYRNLGCFLKFTMLCSPLGLDGFIFEIPGDPYGQDIKSFAKGMKQVLTVLSEHDPKGRHCMNKSYLGQLGWVFEFNGETMFITTFAPFYHESHSRYSFGTKHCYILFQPELSFAQHNLGPDTPHTNWDEPKTVRDRIRVAYKKSGRGYKIRDTVIYPPAWDIVQPLQPGDDVVEWWKY